MASSCKSGTVRFEIADNNQDLEGWLGKEKEEIAPAVAFPSILVQVDVFPLLSASIYLMCWR